MGPGVISMLPNREFLFTDFHGSEGGAIPEVDYV